MAPYFPQDKSHKSLHWPTRLYSYLFLLHYLSLYSSPYTLPQPHLLL